MTKYAPVLQEKFVAIINREMEIPHISVKAMDSMLASVPEPGVPSERATVLRERLIRTLEADLWEVDSWLLRCFVALNTVLFPPMAQFAVDLVQTTRAEVARITRNAENVFPLDATLKAFSQTPPLDHWLKRFAAIPFTLAPADEDMAMFATFRTQMMLAPVKIFQPSLKETIIALVISDPALPKHPIIASTRTFQILTGYPEEQIIGSNCRFFENPSFPLSPSNRHKLNKVSEDDYDPTSFVTTIRGQRHLGLGQFLPFNCLVVSTKIIVEGKVYTLDVQTDLDVFLNQSGGEKMVKEADVVAAIELFLDYMFVMCRGIWFDSMQRAFDIKDVATRHSVTSEEVDKITVDRTSRRKFSRLLSNIPLNVSESLVAVWLPMSQEEQKKCTVSQLERNFSSKGHPWTCTPCKFHAYSARGCNRAESCRYCHEVHVPQKLKYGHKKKSSRARRRGRASEDQSSD